MKNMFQDNILSLLLIFQLSFLVPYARTARILLALSIAGQLVFVYAADFIHWSETTIEYPFLLSYLFVSFIQVRIIISFTSMVPQNLPIFFLNIPNFY